MNTSYRTLLCAAACGLAATARAGTGRVQSAPGGTQHLLLRTDNGEGPDRTQTYPFLSMGDIAQAPAFPLTDYGNPNPDHGLAPNLSLPPTAVEKYAPQDLRADAGVMVQHDNGAYFMAYRDESREQDRRIASGHYDRAQGEPAAQAGQDSADRGKTLVSRLSDLQGRLSNISAKAAPGGEADIAAAMGEIGRAIENSAPKGGSRKDEDRELPDLASFDMLARNLREMGFSDDHAGRLIAIYANAHDPKGAGEHRALVHGGPEFRRMLKSAGLDDKASAKALAAYAKAHRTDDPGEYRALHGVIAANAMALALRGQFGKLDRRVAKALVVSSLLEPVWSAQDLSHGVDWLLNHFGVNGYAEYGSYGWKTGQLFDEMQRGDGGGRRSFAELVRLMSDTRIERGTPERDLRSLQDMQKSWEGVLGGWNNRAAELSVAGLTQQISRSAFFFLPPEEAVEVVRRRAAEQRAMAAAMGRKGPTDEQAIASAAAMLDKLLGGEVEMGFINWSGGGRYEYTARLEGPLQSALRDNYHHFRRLTAAAVNEGRLKASVALDPSWHR